MASYLGIAAGQIPTKHYWGPVRTFYNDNCDYSWTETRPTGGWKTYDGIPVFEGAQGYRDVNVVPTWGGSMFEALMVPLFVPEDQWGPRSWGVNHPLYVRGQIEHGAKSRMRIHERPPVPIRVFSRCRRELVDEAFDDEDV